MRTTFVIALAAIISAPAAAQRGCGIDTDPTKRIEGTGLLPGGWMVRFDPVPSNCTPLKTTDVNFVTMGAGMHVTSGPAAIYYNPGNVLTGEFTVSATFANRTTAGHEALGVFIGGKDLQDSTQRYVYLVVKPASGEILISQRTGDGKPKAIDGLRTEPAVIREPAGGGAASNKVAIRVEKDSVKFLVNEKVVRAVTKSQLGAPTDGLVGLRVNHNLNVHIDGFAVTKQ
ncbi:MAG TPA: hypothetical protein VJR92_10270 [Gemmatimonadaceae bacterium]|nr:hypothetical protein [Gemmatimonadaceae bacterium]